MGTDAKDPDIDKIIPMPQDAPEAHWREWRGKYVIPDSLKKGPKEETFFDDPYPTDCAPLLQPDAVPGDDPKYLAEIWWRIGDWEFDQFDLPGGVVANDPSFAVWDFNRSASAYTHSMQYKKKATIFGIALYKHAWTEFKEQRYEAAVHEFVSLLNFTDEQEKLTGDPGADFRNEAFTYIAGSLDQWDFAGPPPTDPYISRPDILDTAKSPAEAEGKLKIAIDRVQDARLVPQDKSWTIEIYKALGLEYRTINQYKNALTVYQMTLDKWPMDPSAPQTQSAIADVYDLLARQTKVGDERHGYEQKVLEARTALAKYIGDTPWVDANKDNPAAIQAAEDLVRNGLKGAAVAHTRNGQGAVDLAEKLSDPQEQVRQLAYALSEYKLAAIGWAGYLKQDENAPDAYKSRYFYADALHQQVRLSVLLHKVDSKANPEPTTQEIATAAKAAVDVRDSDEDDEFIDNAGLFVVDLADVDRDLAFQRFQDTGGTQGIELRTDVKMASGKVVVDDIPPVIQRSMQARDEYIQRVPPERDKQNHSRDYAFYSADQYYLYGHFKDAEDRFQVIYNQECDGKDPLGYEAWKRLIVMSNIQHNTERSKMLATAETKKACCVTQLQCDEDKKGVLTTAVLIDASFEDAHKAFEAAKAAPEGPQKDALWRTAGKMYEDALRAAPGHRDAPESAINSAYCYKKVGEINKAIDLYNLFISNYGSDDNLNRLQHGGTDPQTKAKVDPDPKQYKERIDYLALAYDALSTTYYGSFAYQQAAQSFAKIATNGRCDDEHRSNAANTAMTLYSNLGDRSNMNKMYDILVDPKMRLDADKRAKADYLKASFEYGQWNPNAGESAANSAARNQAIASLSQYHNANRGKPAAACYALEAAYRIAKMQQTAGDPGYRNWLHTTVSDWEYFKNNPATVASADGKTKGSVTAADSPFVSYAGEADYTLLDEKVHADWDYATGHHRYKGTVVDVKKAVDKDLDELKKWQADLLRVTTTYKGSPASVSALARIGTLYDSVRMGLDLAAPSYVSAETSAKLAKFQKMADLLDSGKLPEATCQAQFKVSCADVADKIQQAIDDTKDELRTAWRTSKETYLKQITQQMVNDYAGAAVLARKANLKDTTFQNGVARLAYFTDYLGDPSMRAFVEAAPDPITPGTMLAYTPGEFTRWRSGVITTPPASGQPAPLPAQP